MKKAEQEMKMKVWKELQALKNSLTQQWYRMTTLARSEGEAQKIMLNCAYSSLYEI